MVSLCDVFRLRDGGVVSLVGAGGKTTLMFQLAHELASCGNSVLTTTTKIFKPGPGLTGGVVIAEDLSKLLERIGGQAPGVLHLTAAAGELATQNKLLGFPPRLIDAVHATGLFQWILVEADGAAGRSLKAPASHEPVIPESSAFVVGVVGLDAVGKPLDDRYVFRSRDYSRITGLAAGSLVTAESVVDALLAPDGMLKGSPPMAKRIVFLNKAEGPERHDAAGEISCSLLERGKEIVHRIVAGSLLPGPLIVNSGLMAD
jgi:probable selenium-dependent hydroxylase accessory protein YqeC